MNFACFAAILRRIAALLVLSVSVGSVVACDRSSEASSSPVEKPEAQRESIPGWKVTIDATMSLQGKQVVSTLRGNVGTAPGPQAHGQLWELWSLGEGHAILGGTSTSQLKQRPSIKQPFFVARDASGAPVQLSVPRTLPSDQRRLLATVVGALTAPRLQGGAPHWQARERDAIGWYAVDYRRTEHGYEGTKREIEQEPAGIRWTVQDSSWKFRVDSKQNVLSIIASEDLTGEAKPLSVGFRISVRADRMQESSRVLPSWKESFPPDYETIPFESAGDATGAEGDAFAASDVTSESVATALDVGSFEQLSWKQIFSSAAYLRLHPEELNRVERLVAEGPQRRLLPAVVLLAQAGTDESQAIVVKWLAARQGEDPETANLILQQLMRRITSPSPSLVELLLRNGREGSEKQRKSFIDAACLAVRMGQEAGRSEYVEWTKRLVSDLKAEPASSLRGQYLASLGRIITPEVLELLLQYSQSSDFEERAGAAAGLGTHGDPAGQDRLARLILEDGDYRVRRSAIHSLTFRGVKTHRETLVRAMRTEKEEVVQLQLVVALSRLLRSDPSVKAELQRAAARGTERIKDEVAHALEARKMG